MPATTAWRFRIEPPQRVEEQVGLLPGPLNDPVVVGRWPVIDVGFRGPLHPALVGDTSETAMHAAQVVDEVPYPPARTGGYGGIEIVDSSTDALQLDTQPV